MQDVLLRVRPAADGWLVESQGEMEPLLFHSGAQAEAQAHVLAESLAQTGADARVIVHDREHRIVGTRRYFAEAEAWTDIT